MQSEDIEQITRNIHALRREMIDITGEISRLLVNKSVSIRSSEYQHLKEKYYSVKYEVKMLQQHLDAHTGKNRESNSFDLEQRT